MAARTQKQKDQWSKRSLLGIVTGLPKWNQSKVTELCKSPLVNDETKRSIQWSITYLASQLKVAECEIRGSWQ